MCGQSWSLSKMDRYNGYVVFPPSLKTSSSSWNAFVGFLWIYFQLHKVLVAFQRVFTHIRVSEYLFNKNRFEDEDTFLVQRVVKIDLTEPIQTKPPSSYVAPTRISLSIMSCLLWNTQLQVSHSGRRCDMLLPNRLRNRNGVRKGHAGFPPCSRKYLHYAVCSVESGHLQCTLRHLK